MPSLRRFYVRHVNGALDGWYSKMSSNVIDIQLRDCVILARQLAPVISGCKGLKYFRYEMGCDNRHDWTTGKIKAIHGVLLEHVRDALLELCLQYRWIDTENGSLNSVSPLRFDAFSNLTWLKISAILLLGDGSDSSDEADGEEAGEAELKRLCDGLPPKLVRLHISECTFVLEQSYHRCLLENALLRAPLPDFHILGMLGVVSSSVYHEHKQLPEKWKKAADSIASAANEKGFQVFLHVWLCESHKRKRDWRGWGMNEYVRWKYEVGPRAPTALYYWGG